MLHTQLIITREVQSKLSHKYKIVCDVNLLHMQPDTMELRMYVGRIIMCSNNNGCDQLTSFISLHFDFFSERASAMIRYGSK